MKAGKKKILFVSQEIMPYLPETRLSHMGRYLPQKIQEKGNEIRTFMPKYGCIRERRNQLHEVIRLSGMNLIINKNDHPLTIKVASIPAARMQVYFIDNEDYFGRQYLIKNENGGEFSDNDERIIFFARGVLETIKKLNWAPDLIHCLGWFSSLVPLYIKKAYNEEPLFQNTKVVYSINGEEFTKPFHKNFKNKIMMEGITKKDVEVVKEPDYVNLNKLAINMSDGVVKGKEEINSDLEQYIADSNKPYLVHQGTDDSSEADEYIKLYNQIFENS